MIKSIYIDGFRHFEDFTINFNYPYTLICGLNGTGKTAVIEILSRLQRFILNKATVSDLFTEIDIPAWEQAQTGSCESSLCLETQIGRAKYSYSLQITTALKNLQSTVSKESLAVNDTSAFESDGAEAAVFGRGGEKKQFPVDNSITALSLARHSSIIVRNFLQQVSERIFSLSINPYTIPAFYFRSTEAQFLEFDASNFSAWYSFLLAREPAAVAQTFPEISNFIQGFKQFSTPPKGGEKEVVADVVLSKRKYSLPFDALSHGQKVLSILHLLVLSITIMI